MKTKNSIYMVVLIAYFLSFFVFFPFKSSFFSPSLTFPSPCGEMGMKLLFSVAVTFAIALMFSSPCGEMGMKLIRKEIKAAFAQFPSPCGEMGMKL